MRTLVIEKSALKNNITVVKEAVGSAYIYANLSSDAYGAGAVQVAKLLREEGIGRFAVDDPATAVALRKAGLVDEEILMLRSLSDKADLETLLDHNVVCSVGNLGHCGRGPHPGGLRHGLRRFCGGGAGKDSFHL